MKIIQVLLSPRIGGAETLAATLEFEFAALGVDCRTVYLDPPRHSQNCVSRILQLRREISAHRPDAIISHSALPNAYVRLVSPARIPVLAVLHSASDDFAIPQLRLAERFLRRRLVRIVAVSDPQRINYTSRFRDRPTPALIPNGVSASFSAKSSQSTNIRRVTTVARVASQKNPTLWAQVADQLASSHPQLTFTWWGPAEEAVDEDFVASYKKKGGLGTFAGPTAVPWEVMEMSDLFFHAADREAHSIGLLEAAATGLPIVCSTDVAKTLPPGLPFAVFQTGDVHDACSAIESAINSAERANLHAREWASRISLKYSASACAQAYLAEIGLLTNPG